MAGHNHYPWCTCGWCTGGWGRGAYSYTKSTYIPLYKWDYDYIERIHSYKSFINPNARCPVCGERVFFYQSPYGGKVFFDELGPPWPKHPCTTTDKDPIQPYDIDTYPSKKPSWQRHNWEPYVCKSIQSKKGFHEIILTNEDEIITRYIARNKLAIQEGSLLYLRRINQEWTEASVLLDNNTSKNIILSVYKDGIKPFEAMIMEPYTKKKSRKSKSSNLSWIRKIDKPYYINLVDDPTTSVLILTYVFFRFFDDEFLINRIVKHPVSIESNMSDLFSYIIKFGIKGFMDNLYNSFKYYEDEHIKILKDVKNVPLANGIQNIIQKKEENLKPDVMKSNFTNKGWTIK